MLWVVFEKVVKSWSYHSVFSRLVISFKYAFLLVVAASCRTSWHAARWRALVPTLASASKYLENKQLAKHMLPQLLILDFLRKFSFTVVFAQARKSSCAIIVLRLATHPLLVGYNVLARRGASHDLVVFASSLLPNELVFFAVNLLLQSCYCVGAECSVLISELHSCRQITCSLSL